MRNLAAAVVLASLALAGVTFTPGGFGGFAEWEPVEGEWEALVLRGSSEELDPEAEEWGAVLAVAYPDEEGVLPTSVEVPPSFVVRAAACISCQLCLSQCPVSAISMDGDNRAVIDPDLCISCGLCVSSCPTQAIFGPSSSTVMALYGLDGEGDETLLQETE